MKAQKATSNESDRQSFLNVNASLQRANSTILELQQALAAQQAESKTQQQRADVAEWNLAHEREAHADSKERAERLSADLVEARKRILRIQRGHQKLSAVVRCALSPEQYCDAKDFAKAQYPELWNENI